MQPTDRWSSAGKDRAPGQLIAKVDELRHDQQWRRVKAKRQLGAYLGQQAHTLGARLYRTGQTILDADERQVIKIVQAVVDTAVATIAARQKPKPQLLTTGAEYALRQDAKRKTRFLQGLLHQPQGQWPNTWELLQQVFKDACIWEGGVLKVYADPQDGKVVHERRFCFDLFFDDVDSHFGDPKCLHEVYSCDRYALAAMYPKQADAIMSAPAYQDPDNEFTIEHDCVAVYEGVRKKCGRYDGRQVIAIKSGSGAVALVDQEYDRSYFQHLILGWEKNSFGVWSQSLVDQIGDLQDIGNDLDERIREQCRLGGNGIIEYNPQAINAEDISRNDSWVMAANSTGQPGIIGFHMPPSYGQDVLAYAERMYALTWQLSGFNEQVSMGASQPGVTAGVAIRALNALQDKRQLTKSRAYEQLYVSLAYRDLDCVQQIIDAGHKMRVDIPESQGEISEIEWDGDLQGIRYTLRIEPSSSYADNVASRLQAIAEWQQSGMIDAQVAQRLTSAASSLDVEALTEQQSAQYRWVGRIISRVQTANEDDAQELYTEIDPPDPMMNLGEAIIQMRDAYREMMADGAEQWRVRVIRDWITQAMALMQQDAAPAGPPGPPGAPPMGPEGPPAGPEMGPPGAPAPVDAAGGVPPMGV